MSHSTQAPLFELAPITPRCLAERPLREWPIGLRPDERLRTCGPAALSDAELLAVLFLGGGKANPVALAQDLISTCGSWRELQHMSLDELAAVPKLGRTRAVQLKAVIELSRRILLATPGERLQIKSPHDIAQLLMADMGHLDQEELRVVLLDTKNRLQAIHTVYRGSLNASMVRVGEVFKEAIRRNSAALIVCHNHPSTDPTPSPEDVLVTRQIVSAGAMLDIEVLDHLIICAGRFVSLRERGLGFSK